MGKKQCDQRCRLEKENTERGDDQVPVFLPERRLAVSDDATGRQCILADTPTLKLSPVKHVDRGTTTELKDGMLAQA